MMMGVLPLLLLLCSQPALGDEGQPLPLQQRSWMTTLRDAPAAARAKAVHTPTPTNESLLHGHCVVALADQFRLGIPYGSVCYSKFCVTGVGIGRNASGRETRYAARRGQRV